MASIVKRKKKYSVVYSYFDENGKKHQKWETFDNNAEAKKRKAEIECELENGTFTIPTAKTVNDLLDEYFAIYGVNNWAMSTYEHNLSLIKNYIKPIIGTMKLTDVSTRVIEKYYQTLKKTKAVSTKTHKPKNEYVTPSTIKTIHKLLHSVFHQAVKWELIQKNPCEYITIPKVTYSRREIWDAETLCKAIELCDDDSIKLALNLACCCSLRIGEMLGLTWDCVYIDDESIESGKAMIYVNKELQRVNKDAMKDLEGKDIIYKFPAVFCRKTTALVLKTPKTATSIRKIYVPKTVAHMLKERYNVNQELMTLFGEEYTDYNLVFCHADGRPIEGQVISKGLQKLIREHDLPPVVFHSLRHSSITYKLKLNGSDIKSVQGDSGHAQVNMVTEIYSHILDEDRRMNAQRFEEQFYSGKARSNSESSNNETSQIGSELALLMKLLQKPELMSLFNSLTENH